MVKVNWGYRTKWSPLLWKGSYEGKEIAFVKGVIVEIKPEKLLVYNASIDDIPANYLTVTHELEKRINKLS